MKYYLKIPQSDGTLVDVPCHPPAIHRGVMKKIFEQSAKVRGGKKTGLKPALGVETLVDDLLDPAELLEVYEGVFDGMRHSIRLIGAEGERIDGEIIEKFRLPELIRAVSRADVHQAIAVIHEMSDALGSLCDVASELQELKDRCEELSSTTTALGTALTHDRASDDNYLRWTFAIQAYLKVITDIGAIERGLDDRKSRLAHAREAWRQSLSVENLVLREAIAFLDPEGAQGFNFHTLAYQDSMDARAAMRTEIETARVHMASCRSLEEAVRNEWQALKSDRDETIGIQDGFPRLFIDLREATDALQRCEEEFRGMTNPAEAKEEIVSHQAYADAVAALTNERWAVRACKNRLQTLAHDVITLHGSQPPLPEPIVTAIHTAETGIERIEDLWTLPQSIPPYRLRSSPIAATEDRTDIPADPASDGISQEHLEELYDLALCVGRVISRDGQRSIIGATMQTILLVLEECRRMSANEAQRYAEPLTQMIETNAERVHDLSDINVRLVSSRSHWLRFKPRSYEVLKLTDLGVEKAHVAKTKYGLSDAQIRGAQERIRGRPQRAPRTQG